MKKTLILIIASLIIELCLYAQENTNAQSNTGSVVSQIEIRVTNAKGAQINSRLNELYSMIKNKQFTAAEKLIKELRSAYEAEFDPKLKQYTFQTRVEFDEFSKTSTEKFEWIDWGYKNCLQMQAFIESDRKDFLAALETLRYIEKIAPISAGTSLEMGYVLTALGKFDEAVVTYRKAYNLSLKYESQKPYRAAALRGMGFSFIELKQIAEAERVFNESLEIDPANKVALNELAYIQSLRESNPEVYSGPNEDLLVGVEGGNLEKVKMALAAKADPNAKNKNGVPALTLASYQGHNEIVKILIEAKADPNAKNKNGSTALMVASCRGYNEIVKMLIEAKADPHAKNNDGATVLMGASQEGHSEVVKILIEAKADPNAKDKNNATALMLASFRGYNEIVKILIEAKADPNAKDKNGLTALMLASYHGNNEIVKMLIEAKADLNIKNKDGTTALSIASQKGHIEIAKMLIEAKADINVDDDLLIGAIEGNLAKVKGSLEAKANPNAKNNNKMTALMLATYHNNIEIVKILLQAKANINAKNNEVGTALMIASVKGNVEIVKILIEAKADPNIKTNNGMTALMLSIFQGNIEIVKILIEAKADVNAKDDYGLTALTLALKVGNAEVVKLLKAAGAVK